MAAYSLKGKRAGAVAYFLVNTSSDPKVRADRLVVDAFSGPRQVRRQGARWEGYEWGVTAFREEEEAKAAADKLRPAIIERLQSTIERAQKRLHRLRMPVRLSDPDKLAPKVEVKTEGLKVSKAEVNAVATMGGLPHPYASPGPLARKVAKPRSAR